MERNAKRKLLVALNTVGLIAVLVINALANALPLNGRNTGEISDSIPNLFVPDGTTFAIWGLIYALLIVFVVYQIAQVRKEPGKEDPIERIGIWFFVSCVANSLWIFAWHWQLQILSLLLILVMLGSLIVMHTRTRLEDASLGFRVAVALPVSVYLGWITVATIANVTSVLVVYGWNRFGLSEVFWTVLVMAVAIVINVLAVVLRGDIWFAFVGIWALFGIYRKRTMPQFEPVPPVVTAAIVGIVVIGLAVVIHLVVKGKRVTRESA